MRGPTKATGSGASPRARGAGTLGMGGDMMGRGELVGRKEEESGHSLMGVDMRGSSEEVCLKERADIQPPTGGNLVGGGARVS